METARVIHSWVAQVVDPRHAFRGLHGWSWYWTDLRAYRRLPNAEQIRVRDLLPALHERAATHELDAHYFYMNAWAVRRIVAAAPARHVDVASQTSLASLLSAVVPVTYLDFRPLPVRLDNLCSVAGTLLQLPFADDSLVSLSCLHVAEHIGLGRYGDPLDPDGTRKAAAELQRVLAPGGCLYFAVPVGRPRICFNAHRIHSVRAVLEAFPRLQLSEFAAVADTGEFQERVSIDAFDHSNYACGMFRFSKP